MFSDDLDQISIKSIFRINLLYSYLIFIEEGVFLFVCFFEAFFVWFFFLVFA